MCAGSDRYQFVPDHGERSGSPRRNYGMGRSGSTPFNTRQLQGTAGAGYFNPNTGQSCVKGGRMSAHGTGRSLGESRRSGDCPESGWGHSAGGSRMPRGSDHAHPGHRFQGTDRSRRSVCHRGEGHRSNKRRVSGPRTTHPISRPGGIGPAYLFTQCREVRKTTLCAQCKSFD